MNILDASAVMHHCYHIGTDPDALTTKLDNEINTAAYGFNQFMTRYMLPLLTDFAPIDILIAHDGGRDYRTALHPEYKMTKSRTEVDPEQKVQQALMLDMMKQFWGAIGCTQAHVDGVEADDLIAYFCQKLEGNINVYTVDVDLMQLQGQYENVEVLLKFEYQTEGSHKGIPYDLTSLAKSMCGDASDNYGGVKGFGPAKWEILVDAYGYDGIKDIEQCVVTGDYSDIEEALEQEENKALRILYDNRAEWHLGYELAQLHPELCWKPRANKLTKIKWYKRLPNLNRVKKVFDAMGCSDLILHEAVTPWLPSSYSIVAEDVDDDLYAEFQAECAKSPIVSFDYETYPSENAMLQKPNGEDYVDVKEALIAGVSFTFGANLEQTFYMPVNHNSEGNVRVEVVGKLLKIAEKASSLCVQNQFFELAVTKTNLDFWLGPLIDTQLMCSYVDENEKDSLKNISKRELGYTQATYAETVGLREDGTQRTMNELSLEEVFTYGCDDATCTAHAWVLYDIIMQLEGSKGFFMENETQSVHSLVDAYLVGCVNDWEALEAQHQKDLKTIKDNDTELRRLLTENASEPDKERAGELFAAEIEYVRAKARKGAIDSITASGLALDSEDAAKHLAAALKNADSDFRKKCFDASAYVPYEQWEESPEFLPTAAQFKAVTLALGFSEPLEKASRKAINEWLVEIRDIDVEARHDEREALTEAQDTFATLLAEASDHIKGRTGPEYEKLCEFSAQHSGAKGKTTSVGDELNTGSWPQMQKLLYCKIGLPVLLRSINDQGSFRDINKLKGSPQTDALAIKTALSENAVEGEWEYLALNCILAIKDATTRCSFYHTSYPLWRHPTDGRMHPQIKNCGTVTRRPSATSPNILQVSKHQQEGVMRSVFVPYDDEEYIVSVDFKQQELCITASESGDENLIACYVGDTPKDVHSATAAGILKMDYADYIAAYEDPKNKDHSRAVKTRKRPAKQTNFLMTYLGEASTLSLRLIIPLNEAEDMMGAAYDTYPRRKPWQNEVIQFARQNGYTQTAYGNRRHVSDNIFSQKSGTRRRMERQAVNAVIQGCAADMLKIVLSKCWKTNLWRDTAATLIGPVYDEITSSVTGRNLVEYIDRLVEIMSITPPGHVVPMAADVSLGINWRDQIELGEHPSEEAILKAAEEGRPSA